MTPRKWSRLLVFALACVLALTLPTAGCGRKQATDPGDGDSVPETGFFRFKPGDHVRYSVLTYRDKSGESEGWFSLDISEAADRKLKVDYAGNFSGEDFSGAAVVSPNYFAADLENSLAADAFAAMCLRPMLTTPWRESFSQGDLRAGGQWSYAGPDGAWTFQVTGEKTFAGVEGFAGSWVAAIGSQTVTCEFCAAPGFPLPLQAKIFSTAKDYFDYTLVEAGGF